MTAFSVVIPLYNGERTILRALASVTAQTHPPAELIVVDDGSTDAGPSPVAAHLPEAKLCSQRNSGPGSARNTGVAASTEDWIAFLDADDVWAPHHLAELASIVDRHPHAALISTAHIEVASGRPPAAWPKARSRDARTINYFRAAARDIGVVCSSTAGARSSALRATGGFTDDFAGQDLAAWARIALHHPVAVSSTVTAAYLRRPDSQMARHAASAPQDPGMQESLRPSPSMRVVLQALADGDFLVPRASLERYLDGRLAVGWRGLLLKRRREEARARLRRLHQPWTRAAWGLRFVAVAPKFLLTTIAFAHSVWKKLRARPAPRRAGADRREG